MNGTRSHAYSPRSHLVSLEGQIRDSLCGKLLPEIAQNRNYINDTDIQNRISNLASVSPDVADQDTPFLTPDVVRNLAYLSPARRESICLKLSQAMAMSAFTKDMNRSMDVLTAASQNPNLPPNRKQELEAKRAQLKDQIELTLKLKQEQSKPLGEIMQYIAQEGIIAQDEAVGAALSQESESRSQHSHYERMNDCADGIFCSASGRP